MPVIGKFQKTLLLAPSPLFEEESRTELLVKQARRSLAANKLTEPSGDNAAEYVAEILKIAPGQAEAIQLGTQVLGRMVALGALSLKQGDLAGARAYHDQAQRWAETYQLGDFNKVILLAKAITVQEQRLAEAKQEQARQARQEQQKRIEQQAKQNELPLAIQSRPPSSSQAQQIEDLMRKAQQALVINRISMPRDHNATAYAEQILALQPQHTGGRGVLEEVVGRHIALAEITLSRGELEEAQKQQRLAARLVQQYGLPSVELDRLTSWIDTAEKHLAERWQASSSAAVTQEAMEEEKKIPVVEWQEKVLN